MPIRRRISADQELTPANVIEQREAAERLAVRAADDRGIFDPTTDPFPGCYLDVQCVPREHAREIALGMAHADGVAEPKQMQTQDLLAMVRLPNNPSDSVERKYRDRIRSPMTGIRAFCVECQGGSPRAVSNCDKLSCPLWAFRMGRNRFRNK